MAGSQAARLHCKLTTSPNCQGKAGGTPAIPAGQALSLQLHDGFCCYCLKRRRRTGCVPVPIPRRGTANTGAWYRLYHGLVLMVPRRGIGAGRFALFAEIGFPSFRGSESDRRIQSAVIIVKVGNPLQSMGCFANAQHDGWGQYEHNTQYGGGGPLRLHRCFINCMQVL